MMSRLLRPYFYLILYALFENMLHSTASTIRAHSDEYKNGQINCDKSEDCTVFCQEPNSCQYAHIECPIDAKCNITCSGPAACQHITINATASSLFVLNDCDSGNDYTCSGLSIYFPPNLNGKRRGILRVGNYFNSKSNEIEFYAVNGWKDIDTSAYFGGFEAEKQVIQGIMHCTSHYNQQCIFALYNWRCANPNDICNNYTSSSVDFNKDKQGEDVSSNEYVQESSHQTPNVLSDLLAVTSGLNQIWYIIGTIVAFLCCFLCLLLCLIRRSYDVHRDAAKGLKTANEELAAFRIIHESFANVPYGNSPYAQSIPMSSQYGTPIPKSKHPSNATSLDINQLSYDEDRQNNFNMMMFHKQQQNNNKNLALYPPSHWLPDTPLNSVKSQATSAMQSDHSVTAKAAHHPMRAQQVHHNPPSIVSVSHKNELGLHFQQIHNLSLQHVRVPSPSFKSVNTLKTINTNASNHTLNTFMVVETPHDENEDEFIDYQYAQQPDHIYNRSMTMTTQTTSTLHTKRMPSGASSSMPLSVNSPSNSPTASALAPTARKSLNVKQKNKEKRRSNLIAHIPQFDGSNKRIEPLPEAHSAEIRRKNHPFERFLGRRRGTADTESTNPFASSAAASSSASSSSAASSSSFTSCTSSRTSCTDSSGSSSDDTYQDEETVEMQQDDDEMKSLQQKNNHHRNQFINEKHQKSKAHSL